MLKQLGQDGLSQNFTLKMEGQLPIVKIEVIGETPKQASDTAVRLVTLMDEAINALQTKYAVDKGDLIVTVRLDLGDNLTTSSSKVKRALVAVAGAGMLFSAGFTIGLDAWLRKRNRKRAGEAEEDAPTSAPPAPGQAVAAASSLVVPTIPGSPDADEAPPSPPRRGPKRAPVAVEYRNAKQQASRASDETAVISMVPSDATVILPLSHNEDWNAHPNGSARR